MALDDSSCDDSVRAHFSDSALLILCGDGDGLQDVSTRWRSPTSAQVSAFSLLDDHLPAGFPKLHERALAEGAAGVTAQEGDEPA